MVLLFVLGGFGLAVAAYLLFASYMRRSDGVQPGYIGLVIMCVSMVGFLAVWFVLRRFGMDLLHGEPRDVFWLLLGVVWLLSAAWLIYERRVSGTVLMDLGRAPMSKVPTTFAAILIALAVSRAATPESRVQAFAYMAWSAWFFVMGRGRLQITERGIVAGGLLGWRRISRCEATAENAVRLNLNKGLQREVNIRLPAHVRDEFIRIVEERKAAG
jgi:hypothetical protein